MPVRRVRGSVAEWEAERRIMAALPRASTHGHGMAPSSVAGDVWPVSMSPQGARSLSAASCGGCNDADSCRWHDPGMEWVRT